MLAYKDKLAVLEACLKEVDEASKKARDAAAQALESAEQCRKIEEKTKKMRTTLDVRPPTLRAFQRGEMVAVWRKTRGASASRWRPGVCLYGAGARQLLACSSRELHQSLGQPASIGKSKGTHNLAPGGILSSIHVNDELGFDEGERLR